MEELREAWALAEGIDRVRRGPWLGRARNRGLLLGHQAERGVACLLLARRLPRREEREKARALALASFLRLTRALELLVRHHPDGRWVLGASLARAQQLCRMLTPREPARGPGGPPGSGQRAPAGPTGGRGAQLKPGGENRRMSP